MAAEVEVLVKEMTATLKAKVVAHSPAAVECIGLIRRLGGPVADLQVDRPLAHLCLYTFACTVRTP